MPSILKEQVIDLLNEYDEQLTPESKFVKAVDKIEPLIHSFHTLGKDSQLKLKLTRESSEKIKEPYIENYPYIKKFSEVLHKVMDERGYWYKGE